MNLEVGMYVRTQSGLIAKIEDEEFDIRYLFGVGTKVPFYQNGNYNNQIVKSSKNIIDLIEPGDYVNGKEVIEICNHEILGKIVVLNTNCNPNIPFLQMKSIVTKE